MSRYPPIPPSSLTTEQHKAYDEASEICSNVFGNKFLYKNEDGAFIGPFAPLLYTPSLVDPFFKLVVELGKLPGLPGPAREIAILVTGSRFKSKYELYAHERVAASTRLTTAQISSVKSGEKPLGDDALDEQGDVAFDVDMRSSERSGCTSARRREVLEVI